MHKQLSSIQLLIFFMLVLSFQVQAQISGKVFKDYNVNGSLESTEPGQLGVTVNAYNAAGTALIVTYTGGGAATNATGEYSIAGAAPNQVRLEFILPNAVYASNGNTGGTTIMFPSTTTQNLAVNYPGDYCQTNPPITVPILVFGSNTQFPNEPTLVSNPFTTRRVDINLPPPVPNAQTLAKVSDIGSVYGSAYNRQTKDIYVSAYLKRYAGFGNGTVGAAGSAGAIYKIANSGTVSVLLDLPASEIGTNPHPNTTTDFLKDPTWWQIGKMGWGDIDMSDDGTKLYAMNLFNRKLYEINATTGAVLNSYPIPGITGGPSWAGPTADNNTDLRPFGLKYYQGSVYVGVVCTAESEFSTSEYDGKNTDYRGFVFKFTPSTGYNTTPILDFQLAGDKATYTYLDGIGNYNFGYPMWMPQSYFTANVNDWTDYRMTLQRAVISDIDFINGDMVVGIRDLSKDMFPARAGTFAPDGITPIDVAAGSAGSQGRLLRACTSNNTTFTIENNGSCGGLSGYNSKNYYRQFLTHSSGDLMGGIGVLPTQQTIISNAQPGGNSGATAFLDEAGKSFDDVDQINIVSTINFLATQDPNTPYANPLFGKANGLGDIELLCNPQPIEIGNRVFMDTDSDGEQDAGEMGIASVIIGIYQGATQVGTTTTAADGSWYFNNSNVTMNGATGLLPNTAYEIKILAANTPSGKQLTTANVATNTKDKIDNDAILSGSDAVIAYTTTSAGENNHSLDFGFKTACNVAFTLASTNVTCFGANDGIITISVTSGIAPYEYSLDDGITFTVPLVSSNKTYNNLSPSPSPYKPTVRDANGCIKKCQ